MGRSVPDRGSDGHERCLQMRASAALGEIRRILQEKNVAAPWTRVYGWSISSLSDEQLQALFAPTLNYIQRKKVEFLVRQVHGCDIALPVLDIGGGTGSVTRELARQCPREFVCLDVDGDAIRCGAVLADAEGLRNIHFISGRFPDIDLDGCFSVVLLDSVLEHIVEYRLWLDRIGTMLPCGGLCLVIVPSVFGGYSVLHDVNWKTLRWKAQPYNHHPGAHVNHFYFKEIVREFERRSMTLVSVFKFQAYYAILKLMVDRLRWRSLDRACSALDYSLAKVLPADVSTRVLVFSKAM